MAMRRPRPLHSPLLRPLVVEREPQPPIEEAFEAIYDRYATIVFSLALRISGDAALAEEALVQVFARLWRGRGRVDPERRGLVAWLIVVTRAIALDLARHDSRSDPAREFASTGAPERSTPVIDDERLDDARIAVNAVLGAMPERQRQTVELAFFHGMTVAEIADILGATEAVAARRLARGARMLGDHLAAGWAGDAAGR